jgi:hypothetical protein
MAYIETTTDPRLPYFYNLSRAVGNGCHNWEEDTMVVQFFLQRMYGTGKLGPAPKGTMKVDGIFGPITRNWILKFQLDAANGPNVNIYADGIVNTAPDGRLDSIYSKTRYTIIYLNAGVRKNEPFLYNNLGTHPEVPAKLRMGFAAMNASRPEIIRAGQLV